MAYIQTTPAQSPPFGPAAATATKAIVMPIPTVTYAQPMRCPL